MADVAKAKAFLEGLQADLEAAAAYQVNKGGQQVGPPVLGAIAPGVRRHIEYWVRHALMALTSSPWLPIEECGELEEGAVYPVWCRSDFSGPAYAEARGGLLTLVDAPVQFRDLDITHIHSMGPIRGPGETT